MAESPAAPKKFWTWKRIGIAIIVAPIAIYLAYMFLLAPRRQGLAERGLFAMDIAIPPGDHLVNVAWQGPTKLWYAYCPNDTASFATICTFIEYTPPGVIAGKFTFTQTR